MVVLPSRQEMFYTHSLVQNPPQDQTPGSAGGWYLLYFFKYGSGPNILNEFPVEEGMELGNLNAEYNQRASALG